MQTEKETGKEQGADLAHPRPEAYDAGNLDEERPSVGDAQDRRPVESPYMNSVEAAAYMKKSVSWLMKQADIPYLKGAPNIYRKQDLDEWFERHMFKPRVK